MLNVTSIAGNIFSDKGLAKKYKRAKAVGECERLLISRMEMERLRLRRRTDKGSDIGLVLEPGRKLNHGDILDAGKLIIVEQIPEKVIKTRVKKGDIDKMIGLAALIGHTIGNRHRPMAFDNGAIIFPIQTDSEVDAFRKLLPAGAKLEVKERVFIPISEVHAHG